MPTWRCPHCGIPQAETARCWVCHRSSTCCSTCRHFRDSVAARVGYCGLDRHRAPLSGRELRPCWEAAPPRAEADEAPRPGPAPDPASHRVFVPIEMLAGTQSEPATAPSAGPVVGPPVGPSPSTPSASPGIGFFVDADA